MMMNTKVTRVLQIFRIGSMVVVCALLAACSMGVAQKESQGYVQSKPVDDAIVVGETTRDEVRRLLGSPSTVSAFPPETWYYISRDRETVAFLAPEVVDQNVAKIEFDKTGKVSAFQTYGHEDGRDVEYVERETPTEGRTLGLMEQLLGNLGRFNTPRDATQARQ